MGKQIVIDSYFGMVRTAIAVDRDLVDYYEESPEQGRNKGNIYRGVVKRVDAPIQAAFVKFAGGRDGFLPLRDAAAGKAPKPGETVLVQVVKDEVGDKGAALTSKLSLSGRYLVYIPERDGEGGISSKVGDEERAALKKVMEGLQIPDGASIILRTAASDKGGNELQADLDRLVETHREILDKFSQGKEPGLLFREAPPALRYLREYYTEDVERIWVNQEEVLDQCRQFFYLYEPKSASKVVLSQDGPLLFQRLGLEADVEKLASRKVGLPSGANIVIDQTEALVAIDVNSAKAGGRPEEKKGKGRGKGGDLEETVFAVNREAAGEIARQLRLRDLGGIIIVDFIDMEQEKHRRQIEEAMRKALSQDKAKVKVYEISPLGIMQISRQRLRKAGHQFSRLACEACQSRGWHPSPSAGALAALRKAEERLHGKKAGQSLVVSVPYPVANKLMNEFREHWVAMEKRYGCSLKLNALPAASGEPAVAQIGGEARAPEREGRPPEKGPRGDQAAALEARTRADARGNEARSGTEDGAADARGRKGRDGRRRGNEGRRTKAQIGPEAPESVPAEAVPIATGPSGQGMDISVPEPPPDSAGIVVGPAVSAPVAEEPAFAVESGVENGPDAAATEPDSQVPASRGRGRRGRRGGRGQRGRSGKPAEGLPRRTADPPKAVTRTAAAPSRPSSGTPERPAGKAKTGKGRPRRRRGRGASDKQGSDKSPH